MKNATPPIALDTLDSGQPAVGSSALFACCSGCGVEICPSEQVPPCHRLRLKCPSCKKIGARERKKRWKKKNPEREPARQRAKARQYAELNCKCRDCGVPLPVGTTLLGWTQKKCQSCSGKAPSRQPQAKRASLRRSYHGNKEGWLKRAAEWKRKNHEWISAYQRGWGKSKKIHTLSYAAQCLVRGTSLAMADIPVALREVNLLRLKLKRMTKDL